MNPALAECANSPALFRERLLIDAGGVPRRLADVVEDWQRRDFEALDAGWCAVAGVPAEDARNRSYQERPRGHSKTSDAVIPLLWGMLFARRPLRCVAAAGDRDQARLIRDAIGRLVELNGLSDAIDLQQYRVVSRVQGSELSIISSDANSSYGILVDAIIVDELSHWPKRELWDSLLSAAAKRSHCVLSVISNAGFQESWQWQVREAIRVNDRWHVGILPGPCASWITPELLEEQRALLPDVAFRRLWLNQWSSGSGDALSADTIERAVDPKHVPMTGREEGVEFVAGLDLGVKRDKSALLVVGKAVGGWKRVEAGMGLTDWGEVRPVYATVAAPSDGRIMLAYTRTWEPPRGRSVDLQEVESEVARVAKQFRCPVHFDPWQACLMAQRLEARVQMRPCPFVAGNLQSMATATLEAFNGRAITLYRDEELLADLRRLRVEERSFGFRLVSPRDGTGHGDLATAFTLALLGARELEGGADLESWLDNGAF